MHWNWSTQACVAVVWIKFLQESGKWAWPTYPTIQVSLRNDWISSKSLSISGGLRISNHCSKYFQCRACIHSFLGAVRRVVRQCSNQHKTISGCLTMQIRQHSQKPDLWKHHQHQFIQVPFTLLCCGTTWTHKRKKNVHPTGTKPSFRTTCVSCPVDRYISTDLIHYSQSMCSNLGTRHFSKVVPIFWNLNDLHKQ